MTTSATTTDRVRDLMRAVMLNPLDLLARLELADAIEDDMRCDPADAWPAIQLPSGVEVERDERGMPWGVRCTMEQWVGENCKRCNRKPYSKRLENRFGRLILMCDECFFLDDTIKIWLAARVCRVWPVGSVDLFDATVWHSREVGNYRFWPKSQYIMNGDIEGNIPDCLCKLCGEFYGVGELRTEDAARFRLNRSALNLGRQRAGMPLLPAS